MIIFQKNKQDFQRWDRERNLGGNDWYEVKNLSEAKGVGRITQFNRY